MADTLFSAREIFNYMNDGEELVVEPFSRLIKEKKLLGYRVRQILALHGYVQRTAGTKRYVRAWNGPLGSMEKRQSIIVNLCMQIEAVFNVVALVYGRSGHWGARTGSEVLR